MKIDGLEWMDWLHKMRAERKIGAVNLQEGYQLLRIRTPEEVLAYEE